MTTTSTSSPASSPDAASTIDPDPIDVDPIELAPIDPGTTLAELVTARPDLAAELERRGLDYCCGGTRSLGEACETAGLDPERTALELAAVPSGPPAPWADLDTIGLVDHLEGTHHAYLHAELPRLSALAAKVHGVHGDRHPELAAVAATFEELRADLEPHLAKEERVLFPMIRQLAEADRPSSPRPAGGTIRIPISVMEHEHDRAGELLDDLHRITGDYAVPADGCASYAALYQGLKALEADTHLHVHIENNVLFPQVIELDASSAARTPVALPSALPGAGAR
jgi:regulator of cell morphogenesis and NO signaling